MSISVGSIIAELDFLFVRPSHKKSILSSDGSIVGLGRLLWESSPVLRRRAAEATSHFRVSVPESSILALLRVHQNGVIPEDLKTLLDLLAVTHQLQLRALQSRCFDVLRDMNAFSELDFPSACSTETVMECFKALLDCPLRTAEIYKDQLNRIARHCNNDQDVMMNAVNLVKEKLGQFVGLGLEGVPLSFDTQKAVIVIREREERCQTALFDGSDLIPVNLFGKFFDLRCPRTGSVVYLKYGSYVLYKYESSVYQKTLRDASDPVEILSGCMKVFARSNSVFALRKEGSYAAVFLWVNDKSFKQIWRKEYKVHEIDFEPENRILVIARYPKNILFYKLENQDLVSLDDEEKNRMEHCIDFLKRQKFWGLRPHIRASHELQIHWLLRTYRMISTSPSVQSKLADRVPDSKKNFSQTFWSLFDCGSCELAKTLCGTSFVDKGSLLSVGGSLYLTKDFPSPEITRTIPTDDQRHSLLDLPLSF